MTKLATHDNGFEVVWFERWQHNRAKVQASTTFVRSGPNSRFERAIFRLTAEAPHTSAAGQGLSVEEEHELASGGRTQTRAQICERLVQVLPLDQLSESVRAKLKFREGWRVTHNERDMVIDAYLPPGCGVARSLDLFRAIVDKSVAPAETRTGVLGPFNQAFAEIEELLEA